MKVYFVSIVLLINEYFSYAQEKDFDETASAGANNNTPRSQSQLLIETESNHRSNIHKTSQETTLNVAENYNEINTNTSNEKKKRKNTIRVFDMKSKQYITVDLAEFSQGQTDITTDNTDAEIFQIGIDSKTQNVVMANKSNNKTVSMVNDSQTQIVDKTNEKITLNNLGIPTVNKASDSKIEIFYMGNNSKTQKWNIADGTKIKIANISSIQRTVVTNNSKRVEKPQNNKNCNLMKNYLIERHETGSLTCEQIIVKICDRIESSENVRCHDDTVIPLRRLCNGYIDCPDGSDEVNCLQQVADKIQLASNILMDAEYSSGCLPRINEDNTFFQQIYIWQNMLKLELRYIYVNGVGSCEKISSIFDSLKIHLCKPIEFFDLVAEDILKLEAELEIFIDNDEILNDVDWSPTSCICNHQFCKTDYCDSRCRRICWQVYILDHYGCLSVTGATTVRLDYICDGKIDCIDETDEVSCMKESATYKHKANTIYNELLESLSREVAVQAYDQDKIEALTDLVTQLQTLTTRTHNPNINTIKVLRDKYFKLLVKIFKKLWTTASEMRELNHAHDFLLSLNQNMIKALKSSYTGNKYVQSSAECYCKDNVCASEVCSRKCTEFCLTESVLTKYKCDGNNTFVSIEVICDGNEDCPGGDDEKYCRHEVCRERQLDKLRLSLEKAGKIIKEIVFEKVLDVWRTKTAQTIIIPGNEEPNRRILVDKVRRILGELLEAYSSMIHTSGTDYLDINGFISVSNIFKETLKSCNK